METVLIYGFAVLIIAVSIAALLKYDVLDIARLLPEQCTLGVGLGCSQFLVSNDQGEQNNDLVQVELQNDLDKDIIVTSFSIIGEGQMEGMWGKDGCTLQQETPVAFGEVRLFALANCDIGIPPGGRINGKLRISYTQGDSLVLAASEGTIDAVVLAALPTLLSPDCVASSEICDGMDNDCDGLRDEELGSKSCGVGACMVTVPFCANGVEQACIPLQPGAEVVDGMDNNCNGQVDETACVCSRANECTPDRRICNGCVYITPGAEVACSDGVDNDCNGECDYDGCNGISHGDANCAVAVINGQQ